MTALVTPEGLETIRAALNKIAIERRKGLLPNGPGIDPRSTDIQEQQLLTALRDHVVVSGPIPNGTVQIGCTVQVLHGDREEEWHVGGYYSTDIRNRVLAYDSPLLLGMLGKTPEKFNELCRMVQGKDVELLSITYPSANAKDAA